MIHPPLFRLPHDDIVKLLLTYGDSYNGSEWVANALLTGEPAHKVIQGGNRWAAATTIRRNFRRRQSTQEVIAAAGPDGLDEFIVDLAVQWARSVAMNAHRVQSADADDISARVGEQLYRVMQKAEQGPWMTQPPSAPAFGEWTKTAVYNVLLSNLRYLRRHPEFPVDTEVLLSSSGASAMRSDVEFTDLLARVPSVTLTDDDQRVIMMLTRLEMTQREAASELGVSPQAVNQRLTRIRAKVPDLARQLVAS
jgi:RNA polymerase sigma factor (sigma-70 family)